MTQRTVKLPPKLRGRSYNMYQDLINLERTA